MHIVPKSMNFQYVSKKQIHATVIADDKLSHFDAEVLFKASEPPLSQLKPAVTLSKLTTAVSEKK